MMHEIEGYDNHEDVKSLISHAICTGVHWDLRYLAARSRISHGLYSTYKG